MSFTADMKAAREAKGYSQTKAAEKLDISAQFWGQIERQSERGADDTVAAMADLVGLTPDWLESHGRDGAADILRTTPADTGIYDDVLVLQVILRKLTPAELTWLVAHTEMFARLRAQNPDGDAAQAERKDTSRRAG